jgi:pentatricopeptide repeat protein
MMLHRRGKPGGKKGELMLVEYNEKVKRDADDLKEWKRKVSILEATPAVTRFNQMIVKCGPYWEDAEAIILRLKDEGHKPTLYTYIALLHSYREARPPQAQKAEVLIDQMRSEGIPLHTTACNAVVDCWCRAGNMQRAEKYVARMEKSAKVYSIWQPRDEKTALASPNEQTYLVLAEGWQRLCMCVRACVRWCAGVCVCVCVGVYREKLRLSVNTHAHTLRSP